MESCRSLAGELPGTRVRSRRLRRYARSRYHLRDDLWGQVSLRRIGGRLRVRWWLADRDCALETEIVRTGDLVILRERRPTDRCLVMAATSVQTTVPLLETDRRICVPGQDHPIAFEDLERWSAPLSPPPRGGGGGWGELRNPWD